MNAGSDRSWTTLQIAPDMVTAEILVGRLRADGIEVAIRADTAILGAARACRLLVSPADAARARALLDASPVSSDELERLALESSPARDAADE